jgi:hypothetical protein
MTEDDDVTGWDLVLGKRGDPDPFLGNRGSAVGKPGRFETAHDANALGIGLPRGKVRFVPTPVSRAALPITVSRRRGEEGASILEQVSTFVFEYHQSVLVVLAEEFEETGLRVEPVAEQDIEAAGLRSDDALNQPKCGRALILMRTQEFEIQQKPEPRPHELENHGAMIVLDPLLAIDREFALLTSRAAALVAAVDFVTVDDRQTMAVKGP